MVRSAVSCDVCGAVIGATSPLSSSGGTLQPPKEFVGSPGMPPSSGAPGGSSYGGTPGPPGEPPYGGAPGGYGQPHGGAPGGYGSPTGYIGAAVPSTNGKAVASLVFAILGFFFCYLIGPILGIVLGGQAKQEIRNSGGVQQGDGIAQAGRILGWVGLALTVLVFVGFAALLMLGNSAGPRFSSIEGDGFSPSPTSDFCIAQPGSPGC
ncbi:MAG TPA: DUF4190 domain-containing protein [Acidimicrobiales bacterium]|nr:DUF4190 domain-containing protein [Acidimicrobiales bacterium]